MVGYPDSAGRSWPSAGRATSSAPRSRAPTAPQSYRAGPDQRRRRPLRRGSLRQLGPRSQQQRPRCRRGTGHGWDRRGLPDRGLRLRRQRVPVESERRTGGLRRGRAGRDRRSRRDGLSRRGGRRAQPGQDEADGARHRQRRRAGGPVRAARGAEQRPATARLANRDAHANPDGHTHRHGHADRHGHRGGSGIPDVPAAPLPGQVAGLVRTGRAGDPG